MGAFRRATALLLTDLRMPILSRFRFPITILAVLALGLWMLAAVVWPWLNHPTLSYRESALHQIDEFLQTARQYPSGDVPFNDARYPVYASIGESCWVRVQQSMMRNRNRYTLEVMRYDDSRMLPYPVHDTIEIVVHAVFPDQSRLEFVYLQGGMSGCRSIASIE